MSIASARQFCGDLFDSGNANARTKIRTYANGLIYVPGYLDETAQRALLADVEATLIEAPLFQPMMPKTGKAFSVEMSNCGPLGWVSDRDGGYRYQAMHPVTGKPWPAIPPLALNAWRELANYPALPDACLINYYDADARMGMHQDSDEKDLRAPVLSLSLGSSCIFRFGGTVRGGKTEAIELKSGDALLLAGDARLCYHGVARILRGTSKLIKNDGRINLTLRRVNVEPPALVPRHPGSA
ncbi:MAG: alpha-ketoglutarate-dependent dioxygenase AlkB [Methylovirgula sp.]